MDTDTPRWFKSSFSTYEAACLEVSLAKSPTWSKSSYSSYETAYCVEVALTEQMVLLLRDSVHPEQAVLGFGRAEWSGFVRLIKAPAH
ncbi:DUF397 domain-containing protein [Nocardiopsis sp. NPDC050513]|uniref:DUF397 domain-containing protein n=1 Tax=Nocardiopsis sp. NPDC050513 TaxID=3364338 RepID=UPI00378D4C16